MNNENKFTIVDNDGKEIVCEVLFTFDSDETKKSYIVYTDNTKDDDGNVRVYASTYNPKEENVSLLPIETEREWKIVETILDSIQEESNKQNKEAE